MFYLSLVSILLAWVLLSLVWDIHCTLGLVVLEMTLYIVRFRFVDLDVIVNENVREVRRSFDIMSEFSQPIRIDILEEGDYDTARNLFLTEVCGWWVSFIKDVDIEELKHPSVSIKINRRLFSFSLRSWWQQSS